MWARLKDKYNELSPDKKRQVTIGVVAAGVLAVALWSYLGSEEEPGEGTAAPRGEASTYRLETKILDKKYHEDRAAELKKATQMYGEIMREMGELRSLVEEEGRLAEDLLGKAGSLGDNGPQASPGPARPFPKPFQPYEEDRLPAEGAAGRPPRKNTAADPATQRPPEVVGAIQMVSVENVAGAEGDKKKDGAAETVYLPPSFVAAHLLSGVDAPVLKEGTANPIPMLLNHYIWLVRGGPRDDPDFGFPANLWKTGQTASYHAPGGDDGETCNGVLHGLTRDSGTTMTAR
jgi:conjugal transfer pilus assembly protein TraB